MLFRRSSWFHGIKHQALESRFLHTANVQDSLRQLLRQTAQPVVVITSLLHHNNPDTVQYHGATLSSFASVAMHPYPLVAFSLRTPSRMATSIHEFHQNLGCTSSPHIVINILASTQADAATRFSRPDLHPTPFTETKWHPSKEGLPILTDCVGALSCEVVASSRLDSVIQEPDHLNNAVLETTNTPVGQIVSELFLARVWRVENSKRPAEEISKPQPHLPLVYHDRQYTTVDRHKKG
jgi:flavin reductase (DIM6/NTAB) family NADH-FMN oxidoreductase RutF